MDIIREITPLSEKDCFYIVDRRKTEFTYPIHCHSEYELNFIEHAPGVRRVVGDSAEVIGEYELVLITGKELEHVWEQNACKSPLIHEITILEMNLPRVKMRVHCSSGTYIRTLCHDIGEKLGCHGCMDKLLRTRVERFCVEDSLTLSQIETIRDEERLEEIIISIDRMFDEEPAVHLNEELSKAAHNGNALPLGVSESKPAAGQKIRVYDADGAFVGLYQYEKERDRQHFRLLKMFYEK